MRKRIVTILAIIASCMAYAEVITGWRLINNEDLGKLENGVYAIVTGANCGSHSYKALANVQDSYGTSTSTSFAFANQIATQVPKESFLTFNLQRVTDANDYTLQNTANSSQYLGVQNKVLSWVYSTTNAKYWEVSGTGNQYLKWQESSNKNALYCKLNNSDYLFMASASSPVTSINLVQKQEIGYSRAVGTADKGTICLPYAVEAKDIVGCTCYEVLGKIIDGEEYQIYLQSVESLEAGMPYIYVVNSGASSVQFMYSGQAVSTPKSKNGLYGTFAQKNDITGMYLLTLNDQNQVVFGECAANSYVDANKAYLNLSGVPTLSTPPSTAPGRQILTLGTPNVGPTTLLDEMNRVGERRHAQGEKRLMNGQLVIVVGDNIYDIYGRKTGGNYE